MGNVSVPSIPLQSGIDRFAFEGENTKDAFVDSSERFLSDEAFQPFDPKCEFANRQ